LIVAKNILQYLKGTLDYGILFSSTDKGSLLTYTDANWAGDIDSRRSTSSIFYKFGTSPIAWTSKLQPTVALSSTKAEYRVLSEVAKNITYFKRLFKELHIYKKLSTPILCDNMSSI
jgi:hypothetical protein